MRQRNHCVTARVVVLLAAIGGLGSVSASVSQAKTVIPLVLPRTSLIAPTASLAKRSTPPFVTNSTVSNGRVTTTINCGRSCKGSVAFSGHGAAYGHAGYSVRGGSHKVTVALSSDALKKLHAKGQLAVRVTVKQKGRKTQTRTLTLHKATTNSKAGKETAPKLQSSPVVTGTPVQGATLSASTGVFTSKTGITYSYQWEVC